MNLVRVSVRPKRIAVTKASVTGKASSAGGTGWNLGGLRATVSGLELRG